MKIKAKVTAYSAIETALTYAIRRGMDRTDKYSPKSLTAYQRELLEKETLNSFYLALEDAGVELV